METMRVPKILRKTLSKVVSHKLTNQFGFGVPITFDQVDVSSSDDVTTLKLNVEVSLRNEDIPKLLKELGIM